MASRGCRDINQLGLNSIRVMIVEMASSMGMDGIFRDELFVADMGIRITKITFKFNSF